MGLAPFGNLLSGAIAHKIGTPATIFLSGLLCFAVALFMIFRKDRIRSAFKDVE